MSSSTATATHPARSTTSSPWLFSAGERPYLALRLKKGEDALKFGRKLVEDYAKTAPAQTEG